MIGYIVETYLHVVATRCNKTKIKDIEELCLRTCILVALVHGVFVLVLE